MKRTLDDHVRAVVACVDRVTCRAPGGTFTSAATRRAACSPTRRRRTCGARGPRRSSPSAARSTSTRTSPRSRATWPAAFVRFDRAHRHASSIERIEGLPGVLTSTGFKLLSPRKEIEQRVDFVRKLHDRSASCAARRAAASSAGEGFVAWPGPAFRVFVEAVHRPQPDALRRLRHRRADRHAGRHPLPDPGLRRRRTTRWPGPPAVRADREGRTRREGLVRHRSRRPLRPRGRLARHDEHLAHGRASGSSTRGGPGRLPAPARSAARSSSTTIRRWAISPWKSKLFVDTTSPRGAKT